MKFKKRHKNDYPTIVVGHPEDWIVKDKNGNPVLDVHKEPMFDNDAWVAARRTANGHQPDGFCIGGSSASVVAGTHPGHENGCLEDTFNGKLELFHQLRGDVPKVKKESPDELFYIGHTFEDAIATVAADTLNKEFFKPNGQVAYLINDARMFRCGILDENGDLKYPHAIADMDRVLEVHDIKTDTLIGYYGLEIKSANFGQTKTPHWTINPDNPLGVPEKYEVQCRHYMGVTNLDGYFIAVQEFSMKPSDMLIRFIPRDINLETRILDNEEAFIQRAIHNEPPQPWEDDPDKFLTGLGEYSEERVNNETPFQLPESAKDCIERYLFWQDKLKEVQKKTGEIEKEMKYAEAELSVYFDHENKEYGSIILPDNRIAFIRQEQKKGRPSYDMDAIKKDFPEIYDKYAVQSIAPSKMKKSERLLIEPYTIPGAAKPEFKTSISIVQNKA